MNEKQRQAKEEANDLFQNFLHCRQGEEDQLLSQLVSVHAAPLIDEIIRFKLPLARRFHADAEDVRNDILVQLLARLRQVRIDPSITAIRSFRDYVAVVSYNACSQYFRKKYPQREALKNRLRYILRHDPKFAIWNQEEDWLCGEARWERSNDPCPSEKLNTFKKEAIASHDEREVLKNIFRAVQMPVRLDDLVDLLAPSEEARFVSLEIVHGSDEARTESGQPAFSKIFLQQAWQEICALPIKQRIALLLNLRDENGGGILIAFPATGVANMRKIAEALEMSAGKLASLWKDLPLDDLQISQILGVTRQQVINLRKCSRERLHRRFSQLRKGN